MSKFSLKNKFFKSAAITLVSVLALGLGLGARASAACVQYDPDATTPTTPVFNNICNVPNGIGNEPDFVRVRKSTNGNVMDNQNNPAYTNTVTDDCKPGDKFDVWTYVHNNAVSGSNDNGNGTGVAHDVQLRLTAPLNTPDDKFDFMSAISASNAAGVQDTGTLNCDDGEVKLKLTPSSVHVYSQQYNWKDLSDSAVNGTTTLGSPEFGSGEVWGCWEYRIVVVYQVTIEEIPVVTPVYRCDVLTVTPLGGRKYRYNVTATAKDGATITGYIYEFGDGQKLDTNDPKKTQVDYTYSKDGTYKPKVTVKFTVNGKPETDSGGDCIREITVKTTTPPEEPTPPTTLPDTGPADTIAVFLTVSALGTGAHHFMTKRRYF